MTVYFGFSEKRLKHMENAAMFAAEHLGIGEHMSALTVVEVKGLPDNHQGLCLANGTILLQKQSLEKQTSAFFHELAHYAQYCEGRLTDTFFVDSYRVEVYQSPFDDKCFGQPHEDEAEDREATLTELWRDQC